MCLTISFLLFSAVKAGTVSGSAASNTVNKSAIISAESGKALSAEAKSNFIYDSLQLHNLGMSRAAMNYAYKGFQKLANKGVVANEDILTVCDFSQPSHKKRMYIIDVKNMKVLVNTYVAHGKNSGLKEATRFSNVHESLQSSLGFYVTKGTYFGKHGLSLRLDGKDRGYNDNAESRAVVVHGAAYIGDHRLGSAYMGRSFGCPAVPQALAPKVINLIKDGTTLFIYHPSAGYLHGSRILNG